MYILIIFVSLAGLWFYMTYFSGPPTSPTLATETASPLSPDVLATLASLTTIKLDNKIFTDPLFTSLTNYGVVIPAQNAGRRNPFAPL